MLEGDAGLEEVLLAPLRRMTEIQVNKHSGWEGIMVLDCLDMPKECTNYVKAQTDVWAVSLRGHDWLFGMGGLCGFQSWEPHEGLLLHHDIGALHAGAQALFSFSQAQFDPAVRERLDGGPCNRSSRRCIGFLHP